MNRYVIGLCFLGTLSGCASLAPPATDWVDAPLSDNTYWEASVPFQQVQYSIPVAAGEALEHMLNLQQDALVVYQWTAAMEDSSLLTAEFHGHTERLDDAPGTVMFYKIHQGGSEAGSLKAPFTGVHGWYFNNQSEQDIQVELTVSGFFE